MEKQYRVRMFIEGRRDDGCGDCGCRGERNVSALREARRGLG
jgi:hypothetical protein